MNIIKLLQKFHSELIGLQESATDLERHLTDNKTKKINTDKLNDSFQKVMELMNKINKACWKEK